LEFVRRSLVAVLASSPTSPTTVVVAFFLKFFCVVFAASCLAMAGGSMLAAEIAV